MPAYALPVYRGFNWRDLQGLVHLIHMVIPNEPKIMPDGKAWTPMGEARTLCRICTRSDSWKYTDAVVTCVFCTTGMTLYWQDPEGKPA